MFWISYFTTYLIQPQHGCCGLHDLSSVKHALFAQRSRSGLKSLPELTVRERMKANMTHSTVP